MIIFDLDDTLIDTTGSITPIQLERALHGMVKAGLVVPHFDGALATLKRMDRASESACQTLKEFLEIVKGDSALLSVGEAIIYGALPENLVVEPLEDAAGVLSQLKKFHDLALVSIGKPSQQLLKMKNAGLDSTIFSKIVISEKQDKTPSYREVLETLHASPAETVVCGDRIQRDLKPAKQLGCKTIQMLWGRAIAGPFSQRNSSDVDFTIRRLSQIQEIIEGL